MKSPQLLNKIIGERKDLIQIIIVGVVMSLGVGFIGSSLIKMYGEPDYKVLIVGFLLVLLGIVFFAIKMSKRSSNSYKINAKLFFNDSNSEILKVPNYKFSEELVENLLAGCVESEVIKKTWERNSLSLNSKKEDADRNKGREIILQCIEYQYLSLLSNHLTMHFMGKTDQGKRMKTYNREDIPKILFENPFLELVTKPRAQRAAFFESVEKGNGSSQFVQLISQTLDGHKWEMFSLKLPLKSEITRPEAGMINVKSRFVEIGAKIEFNGYSSTAPENFIRYYLGESAYSNIESLDVSIELSIKFNKWAMYLNNSWTYERWVDSFAARLENEYSYNNYLKRINWSNIDTLMTTTINFENRKSKTESDDKK